MENRGQIEAWQREIYGAVQPSNDGNSGAAYAPSAMAGVHTVTLNASVTVGAPTPPGNQPIMVGMTLMLVLIQDATGSRSVSWNSAYRNAPAWSAGAANTRALARFRYDGAKWQFIGGSTAFA